MVASQMRQQRSFGPRSKRDIPARGPEGRVRRDDCFAIRALADVGSELAAGLPAVLRTVYRHSSGRLRLGMASYRRITIFR